VLLVDQNEAEIHHRRKDCRARTDDDARLAAPNAMPLLGTFVGRQGRVQHCHLFAKGRKHLPCHRRRKANLRHQ